MSSINYRLNIVIRNDIRKSGPRYKLRRLWSAKNAKKNCNFVRKRCLTRHGDRNIGAKAAGLLCNRGCRLVFVSTQQNRGCGTNFAGYGAPNMAKTAICTKFRPQFLKMCRGWGTEVHRIFWYVHRSNERT